MKIDLHESRRRLRRRLAVICLVTLYCLAPGRLGLADAIDDVPQRLADAQSFRSPLGLIELERKPAPAPHLVPRPRQILEQRTPVRTVLGVDPNETANSGASRLAALVCSSRPHCRLAVGSENGGARL
jgi:hypothetical protein